jgi:hypothetical protein
MILLCTILKVVNGKSLLESEHHSRTAVNGGDRHRIHHRPIRHVLDIRMTCPDKMVFVAGRCRKIL